VPNIERAELSPARPLETGVLPRPKQGDIRRLVSLFHDAKQVYIPLRVRPSTPDATWEKTSALFLAQDAVIFWSKRSHRNGETLLLRHFASPEENSATVIGVFYEEARMALAVRFVDGLPKWLQTA
jgi:hypothetical protein